MNGWLNFEKCWILGSSNSRWTGYDWAIINPGLAALCARSFNWIPHNPSKTCEGKVIWLSSKHLFEKQFGATGSSMVLWSWSILWWMVWLPRRGRWGSCNGVAVCYQIVESQIDLSIFCQLILLLGWRTRTFENGPHPPSPRKMTPHRLLRWKPLETSCWHLRLFCPVLPVSLTWFAYKWRVCIVKSCKTLCNKLASPRGRFIWRALCPETSCAGSPVGVIAQILSEVWRLKFGPKTLRARRWPALKAAKPYPLWLKVNQCILIIVFFVCACCNLGMTGNFMPKLIAQDSPRKKQFPGSWTPCAKMEREGVEHWRSSGSFGGKTFPMYMVPLKTFMTMTKIETHEALMDAGALCRFHESMGNGMFVSHQWITPEHPDPDFHQLGVLQKTLHQLMEGKSRVTLPPMIEISFGRVRCPTAADLKAKALYIWYHLVWFLLLSTGHFQDSGGRSKASDRWHSWICGQVLFLRDSVSFRVHFDGSLKPLDLGSTWLVPFRVHGSTFGPSWWLHHHHQNATASHVSMESSRPSKSTRFGTI